MKHRTQVWLAVAVGWILLGQWVEGQSNRDAAFRPEAGSSAAQPSQSQPAGEGTSARTLPTTTVESVPIPYRPLYPPSAYDPSRRVTANEYFSMYEITGNYQVNKTRSNGDDEAALSEARRKRAIMEEMTAVHVYAPAPAPATDSAQLLSSGQPMVSEPEDKPESNPAPEKAGDSSVPPENVEFVDMRGSSSVTHLRMPRLRKQSDAQEVQEAPFAQEVPDFNTAGRGSNQGSPRKRFEPEPQAPPAPRSSHPLAAAGPPSFPPSAPDLSERSGFLSAMNRRQPNGRGETRQSLPESRRPAPVWPASRPRPESENNAASQGREGGPGRSSVSQPARPEPENRALLASTRSSQENTGLFGRFRRNSAPAEAAPAAPAPPPQPMVSATAIPIAMPPAPPSVTSLSSQSPRPSVGNNRWSVVSGDDTYANVDGQLVKLTPGTRVEVLRGGASITTIRLFDQRQATIATSVLRPE